MATVIKETTGKTASLIVDSTGALKVTGGGGGGGGGDASAANQTSQITQETAIAGGVGTPTDAVVAAGATGSLSAKLRRLTTDLAALIAQIPTSLGAKTGAASLSVVPASDGFATTSVATGNVAGAATDSGNPVKIGAKYNTTPPTYTDGQRADAQSDTRGNIKVTLIQADSLTSVPAANPNSDTQSSSNGSYKVIPYNIVYDGTNWIRQRGDTSGTWVVQKAGTSGGTSLSKTIAAGTTNSTLVKAGLGQVYSVSVNNQNAAVRYLKLYNKVSAPTVGTDTPVAVYAIQPGQTFIKTFPVGAVFTLGIGFGLTTGVADNDTGAVTANEHVVNIGYA